jgi:hypothetical protein
MGRRSEVSASLDTILVLTSYADRFNGVHEATARNSDAAVQEVGVSSVLGSTADGKC